MDLFLYHHHTGQQEEPEKSLPQSGEGREEGPNWKRVSMPEQKGRMFANQINKSLVRSYRFFVQDSNVFCIFFHFPLYIFIFDFLFLLLLLLFICFLVVFTWRYWLPAWLAGWLAVCLAFVVDWVFWFDFVVVVEASVSCYCCYVAAIFCC